MKINPMPAAGGVQRYQLLFLPAKVAVKFRVHFGEHEMSILIEYDEVEFFYGVWTGRIIY